MFFQGWYSDSALTEKYEFGLNKVTSDMTLYAKWIVIDDSDFSWGAAGNNKISLLGFSESGKAKYDSGDLINIYIPKTYKKMEVTQIQANAFKGMEKIEILSIPDSVTNIQDSAFENCTSLYNLILPISVNIVSSANVFKGCTNITNLTFTAGSTTSGTRGQHYNIGGDGWKLTPWYYSKDNNITVEVETWVTRIGDHMFHDCTGLTNITLPNTLTEIGYYAFQNCTNLNNMRFDSSNIQKINEGAFYNCKKMDFNKDLLVNVTEVGKSAFFGCEALTEVNLKNTVKIGESAFQGCKYLDEGSSIESLKQIDNNAFNGCYAFDVSVWPKAIETIGDNAFKDCSSLEGPSDMTWLKTATSVGTSAFEGCIRIRGNLDLSSVKYIGNNTFKNCTGITGSLNLGSAEEIGSSAFEGCTGIAGNVILTNARVIGANAFKGNSKITGQLDLAKAESIGTSAFQNTGSIIKGDLNMTYMQTIGANAFNGSIGITGLEFSESMKSIGDGAFNGDTAIQFVKYPGTYGRWSQVTIAANNTPITSLGQNFGTRAVHGNFAKTDIKLSGNYKIETQVLMKNFGALRNNIWNNGSDNLESVIITSDKKLSFTNNGDTIKSTNELTINTLYSIVEEVNGNTMKLKIDDNEVSGETTSVSNQDLTVFADYSELIMYGFKVYDGDNQLVLDLAPVYAGKEVNGQTAEHNGFFDKVSQNFIYSEDEEFISYGFINTLAGV